MCDGWMTVLPCSPLTRSSSASRSSPSIAVLSSAARLSAPSAPKASVNGVSRSRGLNTGSSWMYSHTGPLIAGAPSERPKTLTTSAITSATAARS